MPNYSHGTKLTLASIEEPPYLTIGTDVSAKYKGAFCEAKITDVNKHVKLRVLFDGCNGTYLIDDSDLKTGSPLETGTRIEAKHPEKKQQTYVQATITKILDHSRYTVVFDDGDQCVLRRNSLCLKSGKHFAESETLDQLPLTNPEHFGNPVKVGAVEQVSNSGITQTNINNKALNNHQVLNDKPKGKSSSTASEESKPNANINETNNNRKRQQQHDYNIDGMKKIKKERGVTNNTSSLGTGSGRRGVSKGRKRRESINNGSKQSAVELDDDSVDSSHDSGDATPGESNVDFDLIEVGVKLMVQYGKGKVQNVYEAKVNKIETNSAGKTRYFVHYTGWNNRYDEWIVRNRIVGIVTEKENGTRDGRAKQSEVASATSVAPTTNASSTVSTSVKEKDKDKEKDKEKEKEKEKDREKDKEREVPSKTRRARQSDITSIASTTNNQTSNSIPSSASTTSSTNSTSSNSTLSSSSLNTTVAAATVTTSAPVISTPSTKDKDKEYPSKTRRSRQIEPTPPVTLAPTQSLPTSVVNSSSSTTAPTSTTTTTTNFTPATVTTTETSSTVVSSNTPSTNATPSTRETQPKSRRSKQVTEVVAKEEPIPPAVPQTQQSETNSTASSNEQNSIDKTKERGVATPKTRRSARPIKKRELKDSCQSSGAQTTSSSDDDAKRSVNSVGSTDYSNSSITGPVEISSQDDDSRTNNVQSDKITQDTKPTQQIETLPKESASEVANHSPVDQSMNSASKKQAPTAAGTNNNNNNNNNNNSASAHFSETEKPVAAPEEAKAVADSKPTDQGDSTSSVKSFNDHNNIIASSNSRPLYRFCEDINESDCDKKISILQERIMALRQEYISLKTELADLDRRRKRPRTERSNSEHINCSLVCKN